MKHIVRISRQRLIIAATLPIALAAIGIVPWHLVHTAAQPAALSAQDALIAAKQPH